MADFNAVASAVAARFAAAAITPPSGEEDIALSTHELPDAIVHEPTVLVFPPEEVDIGYGPSLRKVRAEYPVRFYIYKVRDNARNAVLLNKWLTSLYAQLPATLAHLGLATYVNSAVVDHMGIAALTYGGQEYHGIELTVVVNIGEGMTATA